MRSMYSLFWGAVAAWAFHDGPLWYMRHFSIIADQGVTWFLLSDIVINLFWLAIFVTLIFTIR